MTLLRRSEEDLNGAKLEAARTSEEAQRLKEELRKEEEKMRSALRENLCLSGHVRQLSRELEELRRKHQLTGGSLSINQSRPFVPPSVLHLSAVASFTIQSTAPINCLLTYVIVSSTTRIIHFKTCDN